MTIATTIRNQLGGALMMLGAKQLLALEDGLMFGIQGSPKRITKVIVKLAGDDTYTVEFWEIRGVRKCEKRSEEFGVYVDSLKSTIKAHTGLETVLGDRS